MDIGNTNVRGTLTLSADPTVALGGATKRYVDNGVSNATQIAGTGLALSGKTFSINVSNTTTAVVSSNVVVRSSGVNGQVLLSSANAGVEASWGALNLAQSNSVTGVLGLANGGTGGSNAVTARASLGVSGVYRTSFTNSNLTANAYTLSHNLGQQFVSVSVFDNNNRIVLPDDITMTNSTSCSLDFTSFGALTGTWNVVAVG